MMSKLDDAVDTLRGLRELAAAATRRLLNEHGLA